MKPRHILSAWIIPALIAFGCASSHHHSDAPQPHTGYVDLYSPGNPDLYWDVRQVDASGNDLKLLYSDLKPVEGYVLRIALTPGQHRLRVTLLNRVTTRPAEVKVNVENGKILPLRVTLAEAGATTVLSKETSRGNTFYGRAGRSTKIISDESNIYSISITTDAAVPYTPRDTMDYANPIR